MECWNDDRVLNIFDLIPHSELRIPQSTRKGGSDEDQMVWSCGFPDHF